MSPVEWLSVWLYRRPRLRRGLKCCCWVWFVAMWSVAVASPASAAYSLWSIVGGTEFMAWTGLTDTYGEQVSHYYVSFVDPWTAGFDAAKAQLKGLNVFLPPKWIEAIVAGFSGALFNIWASVSMSFECGILIFFGSASIWFLKIALEAGWLPFMAQIAQPVVTALKQLVQDFYVIPIALLVAIGWGGYVAFSSGRGKGLGIIGGSLWVCLLIFYFLADPVSMTVGPNGVMSIGQDLGFILAEGVVNNGQLIPGNSHAGLQALIGTLCTALLREQIQLVNFGTSVDTIGGCAGAWTNAISAAKPDGPIKAIKGCYPAGYSYGEQLGLASTGWFLMIIIVDFVIFVILVYIAFTVILIGFKALFNLAVLVVAAPVGVAPGPTRDFAKRQAVQTVRYGVEMFASTGGLAIIALVISAVLNAPSDFLNPSESVQNGLNWVIVAQGGARPVDDLNPIAKELIVLAVAIACWLAYSKMLEKFDGPSAGKQFSNYLGEKQRSAVARNFWKSKAAESGLGQRLFKAGAAAAGGAAGVAAAAAAAGGPPPPPPPPPPPDGGGSGAPGRVPPLPYGRGGRSDAGSDIGSYDDDRDFGNDNVSDRSLHAADGYGDHFDAARELSDPLPLGRQANLSRMVDRWRAADGPTFGQDALPYTPPARRPNLLTRARRAPGQFAAAARGVPGQFAAAARGAPAAARGAPGRLMAYGRRNARGFARGFGNQLTPQGRRWIPGGYLDRLDRLNIPEPPPMDYAHREELRQWLNDVPLPMYDERRLEVEDWLHGADAGPEYDGGDVPDFAGTASHPPPPASGQGRPQPATGASPGPRRPQPPTQPTGAGAERRRTNTQGPQVTTDAPARNPRPVNPAEAFFNAYGEGFFPPPDS